MGQKRASASEDDRAAQAKRLRDVRKEKAALEREEREIKEDLLPYVEDIGSFVYLDPDTGEKIVAYFSYSDMTVLDLDELQRCVDEGLVRETVFEMVAPRQPDLKELKAAMAARRLPKKVIQRCVRLEKDRETVKFKKEGEADA